MLDLLTIDPTLKLIVFGLLGFLAGFIVTLIGGGGGLVMVSGLSFVFLAIFPKTVALKFAIGTSIALFPVISISALITLVRLGYVWDLRYFVRVLPCILIGASIGPHLTMALPENILHPLIGFVLIAYAVYQLSGVKPGPHLDLALKPDRRINITIVVTAFVAAVIAGAAGVAIGVFLIPCLAHYLPYRQGVSTSILAAVPSTLIGALSYSLSSSNLPLEGYWHQGYVYIPAFLAMLATTVIGTYAGGRLTDTLPVDRLRKGFNLYILIAGFAIAVK